MTSSKSASCSVKGSVAAQHVEDVLRNRVFSLRIVDDQAFSVIVVNLALISVGAMEGSLARMLIPLITSGTGPRCRIFIIIIEEKGYSAADCSLNCGKGTKQILLQKLIGKRIK